MKKIALFFGSFNPVHKGHIAVAEAVLSKKIARAVWFVLSPQNPFKRTNILWDEDIRAQRLEEALKGREGMEFCDVERHLPKPSYTIQTLTYLWRRYPDCEFCILMGEDNLAGLHKWKEYRRIMEACDIYVYPRAEAAEAKKTEAAEAKKTETAEAGVYPIEKEFPQKIHRLDFPLLDISSTEIRRLMQENRDVSCLLP